jgi:hypothetical protein
MELNDAQMYTVIYVAGLIGLTVFLCIILGGLYFLIGIFLQMMNTIFNNEKVEDTNEYD